MLMKFQLTNFGLILTETYKITFRSLRK